MSKGQIDLDGCTISNLQSRSTTKVSSPHFCVPSYDGDLTGSGTIAVAGGRHVSFSVESARPAELGRCGARRHRRLDRLECPRHGKAPSNRSVAKIRDSK